MGASKIESSKVFDNAISNTGTPCNNLQQLITWPKVLQILNNCRVFCDEVHVKHSGSRASIAVDVYAKCLATWRRESSPFVADRCMTSSYIMTSCNEMLLRPLPDIFDTVWVHNSRGSIGQCAYNTTAATSAIAEM